jgi:hypothetical protein
VVDQETTELIHSYLRMVCGHDPENVSEVIDLTVQMGAGKFSHEDVNEVICLILSESLS